MNIFGKPQTVEYSLNKLKDEIKLLESAHSEYEQKLTGYLSSLYKHSLSLVNKCKELEERLGECK